MVAVGRTLTLIRTTPTHKAHGCQAAAAGTIPDITLIVLIHPTPRHLSTMAAASVAWLKSPTGLIQVTILPSLFQPLV